MDTVVSEFLAQAREVITVKRVFGDAYEQDGATLIPVAAVRGGAGGGSGEGPGEQGGCGSGFGMTARPVGVYVIREGLVSWHPALDLNRVILGGQITAVALALVARAIVRAVRS